MKTFLINILLLLLPLLFYSQQENSLLSGLYNSLAEAESDTARMKAYMNLGSYYHLADRDSSSFYYEKALPVAVRLNLKFDEASALNNIGVILMQQEKFSKSLEYYLKAINILKDPKIEKTIWHLTPGQDPEKIRLLELSNSYDLIGILNAYTGNWTDNTKNQMKNYREAEKYAKAAGDQRQLAYIKFHMGIAYLNEGKLDSALLFIKNSIATFSDLNDLAGLGRATKYLGDTYAKMGNYDLAAQTILQSLPPLQKTNDFVHIALAYISLNRVYTGLNKNDSALYYAKESLKVFEKRKDPFGKEDAYNLLSSSYDRLGQTDSATLYLKMAKTLSDSLGQEERKNLLAFHDVVVNEQAKLEELEKDKIQTQSKIRIYSLIAGLIILSLIGFILHRNNKKEKKANIILEKTLKELKATQSQLVQSEKMASLGELTAGIAHEIQNPLNFVNNFSEVNKELLIEMNEEIEKGNLMEVKSLANNIIENEKKINDHGKRADTIIKGMLQHSRKSSGIKEPTDINALTDEYLRLAYHGLRAKDKNFHAKFETSFDDSIGNINVIPQDFGRVVLNLFNNAFYAVTEKKKQCQADNVEDYEPRVSVTTRRNNGKVEISVRDNGNGIPKNVLDKIFQPFFTTKPSGQGTGLGLSMSYDIIVNGHAGELIPESKEGVGTSFIIRLPNKN